MTDLDDYIDEFVALITRVLGLPLDYYSGFFIHGLMPHIRSRIHTHDPRMVSARLVEADISLDGWLPQPTTPFLATMEATRHNSSAMTAAWGNRPGRTPSPQWIFNIDYNGLRSKSLFIQCCQPYSPNNECSVKGFHAIFDNFDLKVTLADFDSPELFEEDGLDRLELPCFSLG